MSDRNVPSSEISNFRLLIMTSGTSTFPLLKRASSNCNASLGPGSAVWEKSKKRGQTGKISVRSPIFFSPTLIFFFLFPPMRSLVPGYCNAHVIGLPHSLRIPPSLLTFSPVGSLSRKTTVFVGYLSQDLWTKEIVKWVRKSWQFPPEETRKKKSPECGRSQRKHPLDTITDKNN